MKFLIKNLKYILAAVFVIVVGAAVFNFHKPEYTERFFVFDTQAEIVLYGKNARQAATEIKENLYSLEKMINIYNENSFVYKYNSLEVGESIKVPEQVMDLLEKSMEMSAFTDGNFDISISPLVSLWNVKEATVPPPDTNIIAQLERVGYEKLEIRDNVIFKNEDTQIDFGGIAKGYAVDNIRDILIDRGIKRAVINLGGNVCVIGEKDKSIPWNIGIANPFNPTEVYLSVNAKDECIITSGAYQRYFEHEGIRYHHILSPFDGKPAESGVASVTVISENGYQADALSTAVYVCGAQKGLEYIKNMGVEAVIITEDGEIIKTDGVEVNKIYQ